MQTTQLRERIFELTLACPKGNYPAEYPCPFLQLAGLSQDTLITMLAQMDHDALLSLFDLTAPCRCPADPRVNQGDNPAAGPPSPASG